MSDFNVWQHANISRACYINNLKFPLRALKFDIRAGRKASQYDGVIVGYMAVDRPKDTLLLDNVSNCFQVLIVSDALKSFLAENANGHLEFLPIEIRDHNEKAVDLKYWVVNTLNHVNGIDRNNSEVVDCTILEGEVDSIKKLVLDVEEIEKSEQQLFKLKGYVKKHFIDASLAAAIDKAEFTGITWQDATEVNDFK